MSPRNEAPAGAKEGAPEETAGAGAPARGAQAVLEGKKIAVFKLERANLDQAVGALRSIVALNFYVTPKVREEKFEDVLLTLNFKDVSGAAILDMLTEPFGLRWEVRDEVVWILTSEEVGGPLQLRYFDVSDLIGKDEPFRDGEALLEEICTRAHPRYWKEEGDSTLEVHNSILIVRASSGVLDRVETLLAGTRRKALNTVLSAEVRRALAGDRITLKVQDEPLADVLARVQTKTGRNLLLDPRVAPDVARNRVLGLDLDGVALSVVLNMLSVAAGEGFVWTARGDVLMLTLAEYVDGR